MELTPSQAQAVQSALQQWLRDNLINPNHVTDLLATIQVVEESHSFDWQRVTKHTFRLAALCFAVAIISLIFNDALLIIERIINLPIAFRTAITVCLATAVHTWGYRRSLVNPEEKYFNEAIHGLGALLFALAALQLGYHLECIEKENRDKLKHILLLLTSTYGLVAIMVQSNFILSCGMIFFGIWFGAVVGCRAGVHYLGYTYPFRFVLLGIFLIINAHLMRYSQYTIELWSTTRIWGMLYLFNALWALSISGTFWISLLVPEREQWGLQRRLLWTLNFLSAAALSVWHGYKFHDSMTKGFGLVYLCINLYTKYFEFFWDDMYASVFFTFLALSLALLGRYAERMDIVT